MRSRSHFTFRALVNEVFKAMWSTCGTKTKKATTSSFKFKQLRQGAFIDAKKNKTKKNKTKNN